MDRTVTRRYETCDVPVEQGHLRVGLWPAEPEPGGRAPGTQAPTVLLVHGVTASHRTWDLLAERLPGVTLVAPDLRGRGRSTAAGPAGMVRHADDLAAVLDHLGVDRAVLVGHSMGAFVSVVTAHRHPGRVGRLVLVDGGLPLDVPEGLDPEQVIQHVLGPTAERLAMRFPSPEAYFAFWRRHPAFEGRWSDALEDYFDYDLVGEEPLLRAATSREAMVEDTVDLNTGPALAEALAALRHPTLLLTAPRGLLDQEPGLYPPRWLDELAQREPALARTVEVEQLAGVNHYTILLSEEGAAAVAERLAAVVDAEVARAAPASARPHR